MTSEGVMARARAHVVAERERQLAAREAQRRARAAGVAVEDWPAYVSATLDRMLEGLADPPARGVSSPDKSRVFWLECRRVS